MATRLVLIGRQLIDLTALERNTTLQTTGEEMVGTDRPLDRQAGRQVGGKHWYPCTVFKGQTRNQLVALGWDVYCMLNVIECAGALGIGPEEGSNDVMARDEA